MYKPDPMKENCFYMVENGFGMVYKVIPPNPVMARYNIYYEDGSISKNVCIVKCYESSDIEEMGQTYLEGEIHERV